MKMNTKKLVLNSVLLGIGLVLHQIEPAIFGVKPDMNSSWYIFSHNNFISRRSSTKCYRQIYYNEFNFCNDDVYV